MAGDIVIRPLTPDDLEAVLGIDQAYTARSRRGFFEKRLASAQANPKDYVYVAAETQGQLAGYAIARIDEDAFGGAGRAATLDAIAVASDRRGAGVGDALMAELESVLTHKGVTVINTEGYWESGEIIGFLAHAGFTLAPRRVLELDIAATQGF